MIVVVCWCNTTRSHSRGVETRGMEGGGIAKPYLAEYEYIDAFNRIAELPGQVSARRA